MAAHVFAPAAHERCLVLRHSPNERCPAVTNRLLSYVTEDVVFSADDLGDVLGEDVVDRLRRHAGALTAWHQAAAEEGAAQAAAEAAAADPNLLLQQLQPLPPADEGGRGEAAEELEAAAARSTLALLRALKVRVRWAGCKGTAVHQHAQRTTQHTTQTQQSPEGESNLASLQPDRSATVLQALEYAQKVRARLVYGRKLDGRRRNKIRVGAPPTQQTNAHHACLCPLACTAVHVNSWWPRCAGSWPPRWRRTWRAASTRPCCATATSARRGRGCSWSTRWGRGGWRGGLLGCADGWVGGGGAGVSFCLTCPHACLRSETGALLGRPPLPQLKLHRLERARQLGALQAAHDAAAGELAALHSEAGVARAAAAAGAATEAAADVEAFKGQQAALAKEVRMRRGRCLCVYVILCAVFFVAGRASLSCTPPAPRQHRPPTQARGRGARAGRVAR